MFLIGLREPIRGHSNSCGAGELSESCAGKPGQPRRLSPRERMIPRSRVLFFQIDVLNVFDGVIQETFAQAAELFHGVGGEKVQARN